MAPPRKYPRPAPPEYTQESIEPSDHPEEGQEQENPSAPAVDPLQAIFGGNTFGDPSEDNEAPDELQELFESEGIGKKAYHCSLKQVNLPAGQATAWIKNFPNSYPSHDWIVNNCGPGEYCLTFQWRSAVQTGGSVKNRRENIYITISDKCKQQYLDFQLAQRIELMKNNRQKVNDAKMEKILETSISGLDDIAGTAGVPALQRDAKDYVKEIVETAKMLGLTTPDKKSGGIEWDKILPAVMTGVPIIMKMMQDAATRREEQFQNMLTLMLTQSSSNNSQLVELMKAQHGPTKGNEMMKEFMDMIKGAIDVKELLSPKEESLADKVFGLIENVAPALVQVMSLPQPARVTDPRYQFAQNFARTSPDIAALKNDPAEMEKFVRNMDEFFGWEQTDVILQVMGGGAIVRPASCPRDAGKQYPAGDSRNGGSAIPDDPGPA